MASKGKRKTASGVKSRRPQSGRRLEIALIFAAIFAGFCIYFTLPVVEDFVEESKYARRTPEELEYLKSLRAKYSGNVRTLSTRAAYEVANDACDFISRVDAKRKPVDSPNVRALLFGTACVESGFSPRFQDSAGDAIGLFQVEYGTFRDLWNRYIPLYPELYQAILREFSNNGKIEFEDLQKNDVLCGIFARMKYAHFPEPAPSRDDLQAQGEYYKKYYNTHLGKGSAKNYVKRVGRAWQKLQNSE